MPDTNWSPTSQLMMVRAIVGWRVATNADLIAADVVSYMDKRDFGSAIARADRNVGPDLLRWWLEEHLITPSELADLLPAVWDGCEWPRNYGVRWWVRAFKLAGQLGLAPNEPLTVYRGATPTTRRGMAWSTDEASARWFGQRESWMGRDGHLYRTVVRPAAVLMCGMNGRGEEEVVVNPHMLTEIEDLGSVPTLRPRL